MKIIHKWVQIISPCSQWLARCHVTIQPCSAASAPKLWNKTAPSSSLPDAEEIFLHRLANSWHADVFIGPKVSTAIGAKRYSLPMLAYFSSLREAASAAAAPASRADPVTYDSARGHMTVTSQHKDLPLCHGTSVRPSGLFPSVRNNPVGSFVTGVPAKAKHRATKSLRAWCLADLLLQWVWLRWHCQSKVK